MRKPDRFARAVQCYQKDARFFVADMECILAERATRLLRRQFAAIRRLVQQQPCIYAGPGKCQGRDPSTCVINRNNLLVTLDTWRKGEP
jgi:hypothetical protein